MKSGSQLLTEPKDIQDLAEILRTQSFIAFDTEFIRESTFFPIVEIIQVATEDQTWLVDAQIFKKNHPPKEPKAYDPGIQPLLDVFTDPKILKIVHAAQGDQECLYTSFGVVAAPILDTAVAASLCGLGDGIGLGKLLKSVLNIHLKKGHARTNWSVRPLPEQLLHYAQADVEHLVHLGKELMERLEKRSRKQWALDISAKWQDPSLYQADPKLMTEKLGRSSNLDAMGYQALYRLVKWREERVRQMNLPRRWLADDQVLIDLAQVRPKDLAHLSTFRGLNKGEIKSSGNVILAAIQGTPQEPGAPEESIERPQRHPRVATPDTQETQVLDLLRCFVGILADQNQIAARHLLSTAKLLELLRGKFSAREDLVIAGICTAEAAELIGDELLAMVRGQRALRIGDQSVEIVKTEGI